MESASDNFELTNDQAEILINNKEFRTLVSKIIFNANLDINKSYSDLILDKVAEEFEFTKEQLVGKSRKRELVIPRYICMYLFSTNRLAIKMSMMDVCRLFNKAHGLVRIADNYIEAERQVDKRIDNFLKEMKVLIQIKYKNSL